MFKEHGPVFVAYYVTTWTAGAAVCYGGITIAGIDGAVMGVQLLGPGGGGPSTEIPALPPVALVALGVGLLGAGGAALRVRKAAR